MCVCISTGYPFVVNDPFSKAVYIHAGKFSFLLGFWHVSCYPPLQVDCCYKCFSFCKFTLTGITFFKSKKES